MTKNENKMASSFPSLNLTEVSAMGQMQMEHLFVNFKRNSCKGFKKPVEFGWIASNPKLN
jgi:hypothetical protein